MAGDPRSRRSFPRSLTLSGLGIAALWLFYYRPTPESAHGSILFLESSVWGGAYMRSLHRLSAHALLVLTVLHTLRVILTGAYRPPRQGNWVIGVLLLFLALTIALTPAVLVLTGVAFFLRGEQWRLVLPS